MNRKLRIRIDLKLSKNGELVLNTRRWKRTAIWSLLKAKLFEKGYLKVHYRPGVFNDAEFYTKEEGKIILDTFLDKRLLEYTERAVWE